MTKEDVIKSLLESAANNKDTAERNFEHKDYMWCLFIWHLAIEKVMKAKILKLDKEIPFVHDLVKLALIAEYKNTQGRKNDLEEITSYNIEARYEDEKRELYKKADIAYTVKWKTICHEIYNDLLREMENI